MASPEERLALLGQQLTVVTHQLLVMQLQNAELAAAVCQQGAPQARVALRHSDFNVGTTFSVPANFGDSESEEKEGSATASDARVGAPGPRPANRRSKKLRDRSCQRAERIAAAAAEQESVSDRETKGGNGNARMCTRCHGTGLIATGCRAEAAGEKVREGVNALDAGSTAHRAAGSTAQRAAGSAAAEPMQIAVDDLNMEGLFIIALSVEDERAAPLGTTPPEKWTAAMGALSQPGEGCTFIHHDRSSALGVVRPVRDLPYQPWPEDVTSFGKQANQP